MAKENDLIDEAIVNLIHCLSKEGLANEANFGFCKKEANLIFNNLKETYGNSNSIFNPFDVDYVNDLSSLRDAVWAEVLG